jgi:Na+/H+ antiporter NhaD/arsenite permease-like protein
MACALGSYPVPSYAGGPVWIVAAAAAMIGVALCARHCSASPGALAATVSWETLVFLFGVFVIAIGLRNVGLVDRIVDLYAAPASDAARVIVIGSASAIGYAILNNHPMAII